MSQEKIKYKRPFEEKAGGVYSCDKIQLVYRLRFGEGQELLEQMARQGWFEYDHWESRKFGTYRNQFSVKCGADGKLSYWLGVGMVAYGKSRPSDTAKLEFNPNKVGGERSLLWLLRQLWSRAKLREGCEVKQWDLACDWPEPREWYSLRKDARLYEEVMRSKADRTQYLGERNKPGRCKLYNKQMESGLASPLTRLEITVEGLAGPHQVAALWPTVYRMADVQGDADTVGLCLQQGGRDAVHGRAVRVSVYGRQQCDDFVFARLHRPQQGVGGVLAAAPVENRLYPFHVTCPALWKNPQTRVRYSGNLPSVPHFR